MADVCNIAMPAAWTDSGQWPRAAEAYIGAAVPGKYPTCSGVVQLSVCSQKSDASQVLSNFKANSTRIVRIPLTPGQIHDNDDI